MEVHRRAFLATIGAGALSAMSPEDKAEELEHFMIDQLDDVVASKPGAIQSERLAEEARQEAGPRRGTGRIFASSGRVLDPMPARPTLEDFFRLRFAPANHVLRSANHALNTDQPERTVMACLLHDVVLNLMKVDHGWWGAQLVEPYVDERISWGIRYHQALRFYPDDSVGYEYPEMYNRMFGEDYVPPDYIAHAAKEALDHRWYMEARLITVNDTYAFDPDEEVTLEPFLDIIGRNFKQPREGLGFDNSPSAHMWRTISTPDNPL
jgi:hypothetical protein